MVVVLEKKWEYDCNNQFTGNIDPFSRSAKMIHNQLPIERDRTSWCVFLVLSLFCVSSNWDVHWVNLTPLVSKVLGLTRIDSKKGIRE